MSAHGSATDGHEKVTRLMANPMSNIESMTRSESSLDSINLLIERVRENELKLARFRTFELKLIAAETFTEVTRLLLEDFRLDNGHDFVRLLLADPDEELHRLFVDMGIDYESTLGFELIRTEFELSRLGALEPRPILCSHIGQHTFLRKYIANHRSLAILPFGRGKKISGALIIGSRDPERFASGASADFLSGFAAITGACVENTLNRHRLERSGVMDPTTGVRNRRFFDARLEDETIRAQRTGRPLAYMLVDIDLFKRVNDQNGHQAGDQALRGVAKRMSEALRREDILCRYGGEEFAILMPDTNQQDALHIAARVRREIAARPFRVDGDRQIPLTVSIGLVVSSDLEAADDVDERVRQMTEEADTALYRSKNEGRNRVTLARGEAKVVKRITLIDDQMVRA